MTNRYDLLINSINATDKFIVQMFLFAVIALIAYRVLQWVPARARILCGNLYLAVMLALFIFTTVYSGGQ
jgi:hypothetical protein